MGFFSGLAKFFGFIFVFFGIMLLFTSLTGQHIFNNISNLQKIQTEFITLVVDNHYEEIIQEYGGNLTREELKQEVLSYDTSNLFAHSDISYYQDFLSLGLIGSIILLS